MIQPQLALLVFIVMTVHHFGEGDTQSHSKSLGWIEIVARGGTFLVTVYSNHTEVVELFTLIVSGSSEAAVSNVMVACAVMQAGYAICTIYLLVHLLSSLHLESAQQLLLEIIALNFMYYAAPPLLAFMIYFNIYHSQRHLVRVMRMNTWRASSRVTLCVGLAFTLLATLILGLWYSSIQAPTTGYAMTVDARPLLRPVFIVISVLTVPHMVLTHEVVSKTSSRTKKSANSVEETTSGLNCKHRKSTTDFLTDFEIDV